MDTFSVDGKVSTDSIRQDLSMCLTRIGISALTWICSRSSPNVKRNEQDETFVVSSHLLLPKPTVSTGDQLQWDVQHWLSPPDPSMNHNFVLKARHGGTAAWIFESDAIREFKATGSFLWIHGKRMFSELATSALH